MIFIDEKIFFQFKTGLIPIDLTQVFSTKPSEFEISFSVESKDKKAAENYQNGYVAEKAHSFET